MRAAPWTGSSPKLKSTIIRVNIPVFAEKNVAINGVMTGAFFNEGGYWGELSRNRPTYLTKWPKEGMAIKRLGEFQEFLELKTFPVTEHAFYG